MKGEKLKLMINQGQEGAKPIID